MWQAPEIQFEKLSYSNISKPINSENIRFLIDNMFNDFIRVNSCFAELWQGKNSARNFLKSPRIVHIGEAINFVFLLVTRNTSQNATET